MRSMVAGLQVYRRYVVALVLLLVASAVISYYNPVRGDDISLSMWAVRTLLIAIGPINVWIILFGDISNIVSSSGKEILEIILGVFFHALFTLLPLFLLWRHIKNQRLSFLIAATGIWLFKGYFFVIAVWI